VFGAERECASCGAIHTRPKQSYCLACWRDYAAARRASTELAEIIARDANEPRSFVSRYARGDGIEGKPPPPPPGFSPRDLKTGKPLA
jgi:hypothetical protein